MPRPSWPRMYSTTPRPSRATIAIAAHQRHMFDVLINAGVADGAKLSVPGRDPRFGNPLDVFLVFAPPFDDVGDGDQRQIVLVGEYPQFIGLGHRALVLL